MYLSHGIRVVEISVCDPQLWLYARLSLTLKYGDHLTAIETESGIGQQSSNLDQFFSVHFA